MTAINFTVNLKSINNWGAGGNGLITITNNASIALTNWSFQLTTKDFTIQSFWALSMTGSGNSITVKPAGWNLTIAAGQTITSGFGYIGSSFTSASTTTSGVKLSVTPNGSDPKPSSLNLTVSITSTANWTGNPAGGNGLITIKNNSSSPVANWSFALTTTNFQIQNFWALGMTGSGSNITVTGPSWEPTIAANATITSGFGYIGSSTTLTATTVTTGVTIISVPPINPPVNPPVEPPINPPVNPPVDPPINPPVNPPVDPPINPPVNPPTIPIPPITPNANSGRIIGYLPGWLTPPPASNLAQVGYTHVIVAFGVFDLTKPGNIVSAFELISPAYVASLQAVKIKVLLSIGGASSSIASTTVDFDKVVGLASSQSVFETTFVTSVKSLITQYGFDGIDIDIEQGFNDPTKSWNVGSTFTKPTGDIQIMTNILTKLHADIPNILISLTPQTANISPSSAYNQTWANYSALIMQTYSIISWVGIQLYNTGCCYGINQICYAPSVNNSTIATSPDFAVAMAVDLLANWPSQINGRATGWNPYISYLRPDQVVLGYPIPNAQGQSDGAPYAPDAVINRAITCLRTGVAGANSCDTYIPPAAYPGIGGVFGWEISHDTANNYQFAIGLIDTVINGKP